MKTRLLIVASALTLYIGCKSSPLLESQWRGSDITIDGNAAEWNNLIQYPEGSVLGIGIVNDEAFLYLCLTSEDRAVTSQILRFGFTAWFESKAQKGKRFGVHFPLGMTMAGQPPSEEHTVRERDTSMMKERLEASLQTLALLGPGKNDTCPMQRHIADSLGVAACIRYSHETCVYELKVPLHVDSLYKYAIDIGNDTLVQVTLESTVPERRDVNSHASPMNRPPDDEMDQSGGMGHGGHGGGMHRGSGSGMGQRSFEHPMAEPFSQSFTIKIGQKPK